MKKTFVYLLIILLVNVSFLFSPPRELKGPNALCPHQFTRINSYMGFPVNCDSYTFIGAGIKPSYLFQQDFNRQSRPLYILSGTALGYTVYFLSTPFHASLESKLQNKFSGEYSDTEMQKSVLYASFYIGYIILNIIILLLSFFLFEKIVGEFSDKNKNGVGFFRLLLFWLISTQVTKDYFWSPHQQMFNILSPLLCAYLGIRLVKQPLSLKKILTISFGSGLLLLVYGNFLLLLPVILACTFYSSNRPINKLQLLSRAVAISIAFFAPLLLWIGILKMNGIGFYSYETAVFRQFVWIADGLQEGFPVFLKQLGVNIISFLKTLGPLILITLLIISLRFINPKAFQLIKNNDRSIFISTFLFFLLFLLLLGFYADRLTFSLFPLLLCYFAILVDQQKLSTSTKVFITIVILSWHLYIIFFNAPHFSDEHFFL